MVLIEISISTTKYFDSQKQVAEFLDIKNGSKKSIQTRCKRLGFKVNFES